MEWVQYDNHNIDRGYATLTGVECHKPRCYMISFNPYSGLLLRFSYYSMGYTHGYLR
jgi:hypothetical protein